MGVTAISKKGITAIPFASWKFQNVLEKVLHEQNPPFSHSCASSNKKHRHMGCFLAKATQLSLPLKLQVSHLYKYNHASMVQRGSSHTQKNPKKAPQTHTRKIQKKLRRHRNKLLNKALSFLIIINKQTKIKQKKEHTIFTKTNKNQTKQPSFFFLSSFHISLSLSLSLSRASLSLSLSLTLSIFFFFIYFTLNTHKLIQSALVLKLTVYIIFLFILYFSRTIWSLLIKLIQSALVQN